MESLREIMMERGLISHRKHTVRILNFIFATLRGFLLNDKRGFIGRHLDFNRMSGSSTAKVGSYGKPLLEGERKSKRRKCIKKTLESTSPNLGSKPN
jgi:hypothetical protein